jgi:hypothetical protein
VPTEYALGQNYPNPFNPATEISFSLPSAERVTIVLYNVLGNDVAVVVDGQFDAGAHKVTFNAADLPTGVYMYRMTAGDFHASRKMMLVR